MKRLAVTSWYADLKSDRFILSGVLLSPVLSRVPRAQTASQGVGQSEAKRARQNGESSFTSTPEKSVHTIRQGHTAHSRRIQAAEFKFEVLVEASTRDPGPPRGFLGIDTHPEAHGPQFVPSDRLLDSKWIL